MIALVILGAIARCASPTLCPTDAELLQLVRMRDSQQIWDAMQATRSDNGDVISINVKPPERITDVMCNDAIDPAIRAMNCKFTLHYRNMTVFQIARLV
jgi:hypothetical protein